MLEHRWRWRRRSQLPSARSSQCALLLCFGACFVSRASKVLGLLCAKVTSGTLDHAPVPVAAAALEARYLPLATLHLAHTQVPHHRGRLRVVALCLSGRGQQPVVGPEPQSSAALCPGKRATVPRGLAPARASYPWARHAPSHPRAPPERVPATSRAPAAHPLPARLLPAARILYCLAAAPPRRHQVGGSAALLGGVLV